MLLTDFENWLYQTKKELEEDENVDLGSVSVSVNKVRVNHKGLRVFNVKVNDKVWRSKVW